MAPETHKTAYKSSMCPKAQDGYLRMNRGSAAQEALKAEESALFPVTLSCLSDMLNKKKISKAPEFD